MTICKTEEAKNYDCVTLPRHCLGEKCMGWVSSLDIDKSKPQIHPGIHDTSYQGNGYCGMCSKH